MKKLAFLVCLLSALPALADMPLLTRTNTKSIAAIYLVDPGDNKSRFIGSGVFIGEDGDGAVLTARHVANHEDRVVSDRLEVTFGSKEGQRYEVFDQACAAFKAVDICILLVSGDAKANENLIAAGVSCYRPPKAPWDILAAGFTGFRGAPVLQRTGSTGHGFDVPAQHLFSTEVQLIPGMSGGPIFDKFYNVIGVVHGADEASRNLGLFTPTLRAQGLLRNIVSNCDTEPQELSELLPVRFFPNPRLIDVRTIVSPKDKPVEEWENESAVISVETISYANVQEPGPKARVSNEKLALTVGNRTYRFAEFQRVNIGTNGEGWLGRVGDPKAVTVDDGDAVGHTTQFKPVDKLTWKEFKDLFKAGQPVSVVLSADLSWKLQGDQRENEISVSCDPSLDEEISAREKLVDFESEGDRRAARLTIHCRGL